MRVSADVDNLRALGPCILAKIIAMVLQKILSLCTLCAQLLERRAGMASALDTSTLPGPLAAALWPWVDLVEMGAAGMGAQLRLTAENTAALLGRMLRITPPIETAMWDALHASDALAQDLDRTGFFQSEARTAALLALNALILWLQSARFLDNSAESSLTF